MPPGTCCHERQSPPRCVDLRPGRAAGARLAGPRVLQAGTQVSVVSAGFRGSHLLYLRTLKLIRLHGFVEALRLQISARAFDPSAPANLTTVKTAPFCRVSAIPAKETGLASKGRARILYCVNPVLDSAT